ncbi:MAG: copper resistance system multicopper oxidase [Bryobacteraceae bacterium]
MTRRDILKHTSSVGLAAGGFLLRPGLPTWAQSAAETHGGHAVAANLHGLEAISGKTYDLVIDHASVRVDGKEGHAITVNGQLPGPLLRWREGDEIELRVTNRLEEDTSIHWHGILLPFQMDGVPGISFPGIKPGETFTYRFKVKQSGTYWYHSHSNLQEQIGHYGPIVIDPAGTDPVEFDREYVVVLSDWTFMHPHRVFEQLKKSSDSFNFQKRTVGTFIKDVNDKGLGATLSDRLMWGKMRMSPSDIADVTASTYTYLVNGHGPEDNWTGLFEPGQKVRLRIINASAMTIFDVRIPGLPMTVVQADGQNVQPVDTGELQIGVAETYDVVVQPTEEAHTLMCESIDRSGYARATLATRPGMSAPIPPRRPRPTLTMKDMGMAHGDMAGMAGMDHSTMDHSSTHGGTPMEMQAHAHAKGVGVQSLAMMPTNRLNEPGLGLEDQPHLALSYTDLISLDTNPDLRPPARELEIHLTGNMQRFMWSFDGKKFSDIVEPIRFAKDERLRLTLVNDTMMMHPIHLHGMFFEIVNGQERNKPRKHTVLVKPGDKLSVDITADAVGDWAFHCHLLYHMHAGMFQIVSVR